MGLEPAEEVGTAIVVGMETATKGAAGAAMPGVTGAAMAAGRGRVAAGVVETETAVGMGTETAAGRVTVEGKVRVEGKAVALNARQQRAKAGSESGRIL